MSTFDKIHAQRLTRLADALEQDKHGHTEWDYSEVISRHQTCGTVGCAWGAFPYVFPKDYSITWVKDAGCSKPQPDIDGPDSASFLGISEREWDHIFMPRGQNPAEYGGENLSVFATPQQVASNIRAFLVIKAQASK